MPTFQSPACRRFRNSLAILHSIDKVEFDRATDLDEARWRSFRDDPAAAFLRLDGVRAEAIWRLIEARQPKELRTGQHSIAAE